jgi:hypothetical protein
MLLKMPEVREIDLNPIRVFSDGDGILAFDALIVRLDIPLTI